MGDGPGLSFALAVNLLARTDTYSAPPDYFTISLPRMPD